MPSVDFIEKKLMIVSYEIIFSFFNYLFVLNLLPNLKLQFASQTWTSLWRFGFRFKPIISTTPAALKNYT